METDGQKLDSIIESYREELVDIIEQALFSSPDLKEQYIAVQESLDIMIKKRDLYILQRSADHS